MNDKIKNKIKKIKYVAPAMIGFGLLTAGKLNPPLMLVAPAPAVLS